MNDLNDRRKYESDTLEGRMLAEVKKLQSRCEDLQDQINKTNQERVNERDYVKY